MGITSCHLGIEKAPPSRAVRWQQSLETVLPEIAYMFSDALIHFL
jgi:hypothetical protein